MYVKITGVMNPLSSCALITRLTAFPGRSATAAPTISWAVKIP